VAGFFVGWVVIMEVFVHSQDERCQNHQCRAGAFLRYERRQPGLPRGLGRAIEDLGREPRRPGPSRC
jgi:hypothetical protein